MIDKLLAEDMTVNRAYRKLLEKRKAEKDKKDLWRTITKEEGSEKKAAKGKGKNAPKGRKPKRYENPSFGDGFKNKIVCGDNIKVLKKLPSEFCNLILLSPDYNVKGVNYDVPIPVIPYPKYLKKLEKLWIECSRILRKGGRLAINISQTYTEGKDRQTYHETPILADIVNQMRTLNPPLLYLTTVIWNKRHAFKRHPKGAFGSPSHPHFLTNHEYIVVFSKGQWKLEPEVPKAPGDLTKDEYRQWACSVWDITPQSRGKGDHPCPFPEPLAERVIKMLSFVGDTVCDPAVGSGTTSTVAARLGRNYFGCDISPKYCKQAAERTEKARKEFLKSLKAKEDKTVREAA